MWLEDFNPSEWVDTSWSSTESYEKFKEAAKKASAWIKRVQKDEKKARKFDWILAHFLVEIISNKKYDFLIEDLVSTLKRWYWANFALWILSLIYIPISDKIREISNKSLIEFWYKKSVEFLDFDDNNIDEKIKKRINQWSEDIQDSLIIEFSSLQIKQILELQKNSETKEIIDFAWKIFEFFFKELHIQISSSKSRSYSEFILNEVFKILQNIDLEEI